jgi:hypothetical protein
VIETLTKLPVVLQPDWYKSARLRWGIVTSVLTLLAVVTAAGTTPNGAIAGRQRIILAAMRAYERECSGQYGGSCIEKRQALEDALGDFYEAMPRDFKMRETWVALAHPKAIEGEFKLGEEPEFKAGIFYVFKPLQIEYVVKESDSEEKLTSLSISAGSRWSR